MKLSALFNYNGSIYFNNLEEYDNETKYILDWTTFFHVPMELGYEGRHFLDECPEFNCVLTSNKSMLEKSDAVLFHSIDINFKNLPLMRIPSQYYVFFSWEPPTKRYFKSKYVDGYFNLTLSYRLDSDFFAPYGTFIKVARTDSEKSAIEKKVREMVLKKNKLVAFYATRCESPNRRQLYLKELQKHVQVDVFGPCGNVTCQRFDANCFDILYEYNFYFAFENSLCLGYITEKVFERINFFLIPIVLNYSKLYEERLPPKSVIYVTDFHNVQELANYLVYLSNNKTAYLEYFEWRKDYEINTNWRNGCENPKTCSFCSLCTFLHRKNKVTKVKTDLSWWWHDSASCDSTLVPRLVNGSH